MLWSRAHARSDFSDVLAKLAQAIISLTTRAAATVIANVTIRVTTVWTSGAEASCVQAMLAWLALTRLAVAVKCRFGCPTAIAFCIISACQFHIPFYISRTLPNSIAFVPVTLALAHWLDGSEMWLVPALMTATTAIVRCDMLLVTSAASLHMLATRQMRFVTLVAIGAGAAAASVCASVLIDSIFWGRWLWPEGEVFWFNTALGKCAPTS
jgi:alpha-1,6-mannosyltransferase